MNRAKIQLALRDIRTEREPAVRSQKLASLCSELFRQRGVELVVVGGSAIEFYTDGEYVSGDIDLCLLRPAPALTARARQEVMAQLQATGGPRSWQVAGLFVDLLGTVEMASRLPVRQLKGPYGNINLIGPEELFVERVLVSVYPSSNPEARAVAKQLGGVALGGGVEMDWQEVKRLAKLPDYKVWNECQTLVREIVDELKTKNPFHPA